jgi:L-ascorbate metabolism protein UlaG (beta-lactamase superfamily)
LAALDPKEDLVVWLGYSSYFVQVGGKRLLIDPVFSSYAAPLPGMVRAFKGTTIYAMDEIPAVDYILLSHDHYGHLDRASIMALQSKTRFVMAGLGIGAHLEHWGLPSEKIKEGDWQTTFEVDAGIKIHLLPSRHYSGRFTDRNRSLWVSFAVETAARRLYFSGDTGFGPHLPRLRDALVPSTL